MTTIFVNGNGGVERNFDGIRDATGKRQQHLRDNGAEGLALYPGRRDNNILHSGRGREDWQADGGQHFNLGWPPKGGTHKI